MSENTEFKVGDVVVLKSGGPTMTINKIAQWREGDEELSARCDWFVGSKATQGVLLLANLEIA